MRSHEVVVLSPVSTEISGVLKAPEAMLIEELVSEPSVEALSERILDRLPWSNEVMFDALGAAPGVEGLARELRSVVTADSPWLAIRLDRSIEDAGDSLCRQGNIKLHADVAAGEVVDSGEDPQCTTVCHRITDEVHRPAVVGRYRLWDRGPWCLRRSIASLSPDSEPMLLVHAVDALVVD